MLSPFPYTTAILAGFCFICFLAAHHVMASVGDHPDRYPGFVIRSFMTE